MRFLPNEPEILSFNRPLFYSGDAILTAVQQQLKLLKDEDNLSEQDLLRKKFLHRINSIIINHKIYNLSIDEAVQVGLLE